jgi:1-acyl-sn-glycerol-3-phosphate acyltransferase
VSLGRRSSLGRSLGGILRLVHHVQTEGFDRIPVQGRFIMATNHVGVRGGLLLTSLLSRELVFLTSARFLRFPLIRSLARRTAPVFVSPVDMLATCLLDRAGEVLDAGALLGVMVDGRQMDLRRGSPKRGAAYLAARLSADILPIRVQLRGPLARFHVGECVPMPTAVSRPVLDAAMMRVVMALGDGA